MGCYPVLPWTVPACEVGPSGLVDVSIGDALSKAPPKIRAQLSQFGSMALTFTSASPVNVVAGIEMLNLEQSLIFVAPFQAVGHLGHTGMQSSGRTSGRDRIYQATGL